MPSRALLPKAEMIRRLEGQRRRIYDLEIQLAVHREKRDQLALELVENYDLTWRETAQYAGFENPYIATILRRARSA